MKPVEYGIESWSYREFTARQNYPCENCGGIIPKGTTYLRHVVRQGVRKGKDPLRNVHVHLDCGAPWYHPPMDDRCRNLRQLPGRIPPPEAQISRLMGVRHSIAIDSPYGKMLLQLPAELSQRMLHAPDERLQAGVTAEIQQAIELLLYSLSAAAGNRRRGQKISHALNELQLATGYVPNTNHDLELELGLEPDTD